MNRDKLRNMRNPEAEIQKAILRFILDIIEMDSNRVQHIIMEAEKAGIREEKTIEIIELSDGSFKINRLEHKPMKDK